MIDTVLFVLSLVLFCYSLGISLKGLTTALITFRFFTFDGLCLLPRQPVSWTLTVLSNRLFKFTQLSAIYPYVSIFFDGDITPTLLGLVYTLLLFQRGSGEKSTTQWSKRKIFSYLVIFFLSPLAWVHRYYALHNFRLEALEHYSGRTHESQLFNHAFSFADSFYNTHGE